MTDAKGSPSNILLELQGLTKHFLGVTAVDEVDLIIHSGELVCLIGPNGSGKTTMFNCITGFLKVDAGKIFFRGEDITGNKPHQTVLKGLSRTFQNVRIFPSLSVLENLMLVAQQHQEDRLIHRLLQTPMIRKYEAQAEAQADDLIDMLDLKRMRDLPAGSLSYGQRKLLEFACALIPDPDLILLDEPAAAVNPTMIERMKTYIRNFNQRGKTFMIVEHNMDVVMDLAERIIVLDTGCKIAEGSPSEIQNNEQVLEAYFGR